MGEWLRPEVWRPLLTLGLAAMAGAAAGAWFLWKKGKLRAVSGEVMRYLVIGVLTTVVSIASYALLTEGLSIHYVHPVKEHPWGQRVVRFYDPDGHIIEVGEAMTAVCRRFLESGMTPEQAAERMGVPMKFVRGCMRKLGMEESTK